MEDGPLHPVCHFLPCMQSKLCEDMQTHEGYDICNASNVLMHASSVTYMLPAAQVLPNSATFGFSNFNLKSCNVNAVCRVFGLNNNDCAWQYCQHFFVIQGFLDKGSPCCQQNAAAFAFAWALAEEHCSRRPRCGSLLWLWVCECGGPANWAQFTGD